MDNPHYNLLSVTMEWQWSSNGLAIDKKQSAECTLITHCKPPATPLPVHRSTIV